MVHKHHQRYSMLAHLIQQSSYSCIWFLLRSFCPINVHFTPELPLLTDQLDHFTSALRQKCIKHRSSGTAARSSSGETVWAPAGCRHRVQRLFHNHISVIRLQLIICIVNPRSQLHIWRKWSEWSLLLEEMQRHVHRECHESSKNILPIRDTWCIYCLNIWWLFSPSFIKNIYVFLKLLD